jgi:hypothetical protein
MLGSKGKRLWQFWQALNRQNPPEAPDGPTQVDILSYCGSVHTVHYKRCVSSHCYYHIIAMHTSENLIIKQAGVEVNIPLPATLRPIAEQVKASLLPAFAAADDGRAWLSAVFGGQCNVEEYFEELVYIKATYEPIINAFLEHSAQSLQKHSRSDEAVRLHAPRIDLVSWLDKPDTKPPSEPLLAASVSMPVIGLVQLLNYWVMMKVLDKTPAEIRRYFQGLCELLFISR